MTFHFVSVSFSHYMNSDAHGSGVSGSVSQFVPSALRVINLLALLFWFGVGVALPAVSGQTTISTKASNGAEDSLSPAQSVGLTAEEVRWLAEHKTLSLGVDPAWEPYESFNESGAYQGIAADYMKLLERRLGITLAPIVNSNWNQTMDKIKAGQIDVASALARTPERDHYLNFTRPYLKTPIAIVTRDTHGAVDKLALLSGRKVALPRDYAFSEMAVKHQPDIIPVYVDTVYDALKKVANNEAEAVICDMPSLSFKIREYNLLNLKIAGVAPFETEGMRIGVRKDWPELARIFDKALDSITAEEDLQIRQRWIGVENTGSLPELTPDERQWLRENPVIRVMVDPDWAPIEYLDKNGQAAGVASEYMNRISQMLKVKFEPVRGKSWSVMLKELQRGEIMMASCLRPNDTRQKSILFTPDYISVPTGIFTRNEVPFSDLKALNGKPVALVKGHAMYDYIKSAYPNIVVIETDDRKEGMALVSEGRAYAFLDALPVGCHGISSFRFTNLRLTGEVDFKYQMSMGVSTNYPQLAAILRKALNAIPETDRASYYEKWFSAPEDYKIDYAIIWKIGLLSGGVVLFFVFWNRRLENRVRIRTAELAQANARLQNELVERERIETEQKQLEEQLAQAQKMESIGRLAGGVAHDFNNMLCVILGHGELLQQDLPRDSSAQESLAQIMDAGIRARNLTQQLLAFSRKQVLQIQVVDINQAVRNMETMIRRLLGEDIQMTIRVHPEPERIKADVTRLEQVILNLCINARDAMPNGGKLTLETGPAALDPAFCAAHPGLKPGEYVRLSVSDTGIGMSKETQQRIFDPFFTTKDISKGTGLGLATVYGIVKQHEGEVLVESVPGRGTTFTIFLPKTGEAIAAPEGEKHEPVVLSRGETILVVEDEQALRKLTCSMLRRLGYNVLAAETARESIQLASPSRRIDLLLTDVVMPELNGREVQERIQAICPKVKTLYMSGYTDEVIGRHGILEEGVHFIPKPFTAGSLSQKIREALDA